jgi:ectoine hydroxylase-related dioxygenase (phytanoyl-CoA dioxygenase family)
LVGVYLTPVTGEFAGNFTVWPGSHIQLQSYFRRCGPTVMYEGRPTIDLGGSLRLPAMPGDVIIAHYQLAHTAAVNLSCNDRIAIYFRLWLRDIDDRRWELLTNIWTGWRL